MMRRVVVVGPSLAARGGIAQVSAAYDRAGLFNGDADGFDIRYFVSTTDAPAPLRFLFGAWRLIAFALTPFPRGTILHLHTTRRASFWRKAAYAALGRLRGAVILHHVHSFGLLDAMASGGSLVKRATRATLRRADGIIALTPTMARRIREHLVDVPIHVLPNPVDLPSGEARQLPPREHALLAYLGWFIREKGVFDLLDAIAILRARGVSCRAVLAGEHNLTSLHEGITRRDLGELVSVAGWLDRDGVSHLLHRCTMLVLPSHQEGFGLVLVEAMAAGTPIVACPVGGVLDVVVEGRNAIFARPGEPAELAEAISALLSNAPLRRSMEACGPTDAERFAPASVVGSLLAIYRSSGGDRR